MAQMKQPESVEITVSWGELETIREGLRSLKTYGTVEEHDKAINLLADLSEDK